jgi:hypothetical protein
MKLKKEKEIDFMIQVQVIINSKLNKKKIKIKVIKSIINDFFKYEFIFIKFDQY